MRRKQNEQARVDEASAAFGASSKVIQEHAEHHTQPTTGEWRDNDDARAELLDAIERRAPIRFSDAALRNLRQHYTAAYTEYQRCLIAIHQAVASGVAPSTTLMGNEAMALHELTEARGRLLAAISASAASP